MSNTAPVNSSTRTLSPSGHWIILSAIGTGTLMTALDGSVVNTLLPVLRQQFNVEVATIEWVVTAYLLVTSSLLLSFGRLGDLYGHKRTYMLGFIVFVLSSMTCGLAHTAWALVLSRSVQAIGSAMLAANSPAILTKNFPARQRGQALGLQSTMTYLGLVLGPSFGGWLATHLSWRAVFYINVPIGVLALFLSARFIPEDHHHRVQTPFDWRGAVLFSLGLLALMAGLNRGHTWGWSSWPTLTTLALGVILLSIFVWIEWHTPAPLLDLRLFQNLTFSGATLSAVLNYVCLYGIIFLMPFYLIEGRGWNAAQAGAILMAQPLLMATLAPISGTLSDRIGTRWPSVMGMALLTLGLWGYANLPADASRWRIILNLALSGSGIGIFITPNTSALMGAAPRERQGTAGGVMSTARNLGMTLGIGIAGALFNTALARQTESAVIFPAIHFAFGALSGLGVLATLITLGRSRLDRDPTP